MTSQRLVEIEARLRAATPDCGDNSCQFALEKKGMRTNGGCRCLSTRSGTTATPVEKYAHYCRQDIPFLLSLLREATEALEGIVSEYADMSDAEDIRADWFSRARACLAKLREGGEG